MKKVRYSNRLGMLVLAAFLVTTGLQIAGCDQGAKANNKSQSELNTIAPGPVAQGPSEKPVALAIEKPAPLVKEAARPVEKKSELERKIAAASDFFAWNSLRERYLATGTPNPKVDAAIAAREQELREQLPPKAASEYFEILGWRWRMQAGSATPAEGKDGNMIAEFLVLKLAPLQVKPDQEVQMSMRLKVDKSHEHYFDEKRHGSVDFPVPAETSNEAWPVGEIRLLKRPAVVPVLPYNLFVSFNVMTKDGQRFVERLGGGQGLADLGWLTGLPEEQAADTAAQK